MGRFPRRAVFLCLSTSWRALFFQGFKAWDLLKRIPIDFKVSFIEV